MLFSLISSLSYIKNFTESFTKIYQQQWQHITMFSITALRNLLQVSILPIICFTDPFQRIGWFPKMCLRPNSCVSRFLKQEKSQKSCPHPPTHPPTSSSALISPKTGSTVSLKKYLLHVHIWRLKRCKLAANMPNDGAICLQPQALAINFYAD